MTKLDDDTIVGWQSSQRAANLVASFMDLGLFLGPLAFIGVSFVVQWRSDSLRLKIIEAHICRDPSYPRTELTLFIKCAKPLIRTDECFLRHVFGVGAFMQDTITDIEHASLIACDKLTECRRVTATGVLDQVAVGRRTHGYSVIQVTS